VRNLTQLTADKILSIAIPETLFSASAQEARQEYRTLARLWHPDCQSEPNSIHVFAHIVELYRLAQEKLVTGDWDLNCEKIEEQVARLRRFKLTDNSVVTCKYRICQPFELGKMYVSENSVSFEIENQFEELFEQGRRRIHAIRFKNDAMALEMSKYLPQIIREFKTSSARVLIVRKTPDQILLSDIIKHFNGRLSPIEHVGWILNNLLNIACYLEWAGLTHNGITAHTVFVSPLRHCSMLLGGWWYATKAGEPLAFLPEDAVPSVPPDVLRTKRADHRTDLELIRSIGRQLLGDATGASLTFDKSLPPTLVEWLQLPSSGSAIEDYKTLKREILTDAFGPPRFVNWKLDADTIYKEK